MEKVNTSKGQIILSGFPFQNLILLGSWFLANFLKQDFTEPARALEIRLFPKSVNGKPKTTNSVENLNFILISKYLRRQTTFSPNPMPLIYDRIIFFFLSILSNLFNKYGLEFTQDTI